MRRLFTSAKIVGMKIERHAFISYAHIDNELLPEEHDGWVTRFHKVLSQMLAGRLGEKVNIWRDDTLRPGMKFPAEIDDKLKHTAVLISVLSPTPPMAMYIPCSRAFSETARIARAVISSGRRVPNVSKNWPTASTSASQSLRETANSFAIALPGSVRPLMSMSVGLGSCPRRSFRSARTPIMAALSVHKLRSARRKTTPAASAAAAKSRRRARLHVTPPDAVTHLT